MIDHAFVADADPELEARLRVALEEMIPKLVADNAPAHAAFAPTAGSRAVAPLDVVALAAARRRRPRRLIAAALTAAVMLFGLVVIARRAAEAPAPHDAASSTAAPAWYSLIRASIPPRFTSIAATLATGQQRWFVAVDPAVGKSLEIRVEAGFYSTAAPTTVDAIGTWVQTPQGWSVRTPTGLLVTVACDIGARGREFPGPPNYCDTASTAPFTSLEIRATAAALATTVTDALFATPPPPSITPTPTTEVASMIASVVPGQHLVSDIDWGNPGTDHLYDFAVAGGSGAAAATPGTSVRVLHGLYPAPAPTGKASWALYGDAAAFWVFGPSGTAIRISTTDPSPESLTRLEALARSLAGLDPAAASDHPASPTLPPASVTPAAQARTLAWEAAINDVVTNAGLTLAGTEYSPGDVQPFTGSGLANVGAGQIEFTVRAFGVDEYRSDPAWQQRTAGANQPGQPVAEGTMFVTDNPATSARKVVIVTPSAIVTVVAREVSTAELPALAVFVRAAQRLAAAVPTVLNPS